MYKQQFLQTELCQLLQTIPSGTAPAFGSMTLHQMIEHMAYSVQVAYGAIPVPAINTGEVQQKAYRWIMTDSTFKDNTPNPLLTPEILTVKTASINEAIINLQNSIDTFFTFYKNNTEQRVLNAFFGPLNFEEQVHLLHKHAWHHLRQFGVSVNAL